MDIVSAIIFESPPGAGEVSGSIQIEPGVWNMIAIPSRFGRWNATSHALENDASVAKVKGYVVDQLADKYPGATVVRCSRYWGDDNAYLDFIPSVHGEGDPQNFELMPVDVGPDPDAPEIAGFWIFVNNATPMTLEWTAWL